jgi:transposase
MVRARRPDELCGWISEAAKSGIRDLASFANALLPDIDAVRAGVREHWSNGQVEGSVNRLKTIKRSMYGRAKFDLLRLRVLHPT